MSPSKRKLVCVLTGLALAVGPSALNGQSSGPTAKVRLGSGLGPVGWDSTLSAGYWPVFKVRAPLGTGAGQSEEYRLRSNRRPPIGPLLHTLSAPAHWDHRDLLTLGIVAATTGAAVLVEESVFEHLEENRSGFADDLERIGDIYGTPLFTGPVSLALYGSGLLFHSTPVKETGLMMVEALLLTAAVQQPLRLAVGRARPLTGEGHLSFDPFNAANEYAAFILHRDQAAEENARIPRNFGFFKSFGNIGDQIGQAGVGRGAGVGAVGRRSSHCHHTNISPTVD